MSAVIVVAPVIAWPLLCSAAATVAAGLGFQFKLEKEKEKRILAEREKALIRNVEWELKKAEILAETLSRDEEFTITKQDVKVTFRKDVKGRCKICVEGKKSKEELRRIGERIYQEIARKYAYDKVTRLLKKRGYKIISEEKLADDSIKIRLRKWG